MRFFLFLTLVLSQTALGQADSIRLKTIPSVEIVRSMRVEKTQTRVIEKEMIDVLAPIDVGDLLQKLPGTTIRTYGAIGALKTVSFNGMGAQHSAILIDGFLVQNMLAGQVNLSQLQVEGISNVSLEDEQLRNRLLPVKSRLYGSSVLLGSGLFYKGAKKGNELNVSLGMGSFDTYDVGMRFKKTEERSFISAFAYYRRSTGDFLYRFDNGIQSLIDERSNNQFEELAASIAGGIDFSNSWRGRIRVSGKKIDQDLPGAIILYNDLQDEQMETQEVSVELDATYHKSPHFVRTYYSGVMRETEYYDPTYLNQNGYLRNLYQEHGHTLGSTSFHTLGRVDLETGLSLGLEFLNSEGVDFGMPYRFTNAGYARLEHNFGNWQAQYQLGAYLVAQSQLEETRQYQRLMPRIKFIRPASSWLNSLELSSTYRLPSFSELYFGGIGNPDLMPESAYQFKYGVTKSFNKGRLKSVIDLSVNSSYVDNKIVAVPTKNMFVWSIQNLNKTIAGAIVIANNTNVQLSKVALSFTTNYQFQSVLDVSDSESPTYLHQVAYVPNHTASLDIGVKIQRIQFNLSNYLVGFRYVLNENTYTNLENGYLTTDLSVKYTVVDKEKHNLTIQVALKNMFDIQYAFIRGFVMPGRNYLIKLRYGLN
jgi:outer membrane cobalamin receptor